MRGRGRGRGRGLGSGPTRRSLSFAVVSSFGDGGRSRRRTTGGSGARRDGATGLRVWFVRRALAVGRTSGAKVGAISMLFVLHRTRCIDAADREALSSLAKVAACSALHASCLQGAIGSEATVRLGSKSRPTAPTRRHVVRGGHAQAGRRDAPNSQFFVAS